MIKIIFQFWMLWPTKMPRIRAYAHTRTQRFRGNSILFFHAILPYTPPATIFYIENCVRMSERGNNNGWPTNKIDKNHKQKRNNTHAHASDVPDPHIWCIWCVIVICVTRNGCWSHAIQNIKIDATEQIFLLSVSCTKTKTIKSNKMNAKIFGFRLT